MSTIEKQLKEKYAKYKTKYLTEKEKNLKGAGKIDDKYNKFMFSVSVGSKDNENMESVNDIRQLSDNINNMLRTMLNYFNNLALKDPMFDIKLSTMIPEVHDKNNNLLYKDVLLSINYSRTNVLPVCDVTNTSCNVTKKYEPVVELILEKGSHKNKILVSYVVDGSDQIQDIKKLYYSDEEHIEVKNTVQNKMEEVKMQSVKNLMSKPKLTMQTVFEQLPSIEAKISHVSTNNNIPVTVQSLNGKTQKINIADSNIQPTPGITNKNKDTIIEVADQLSTKMNKDIVIKSTGPVSVESIKTDMVVVPKSKTTTNLVQLHNRVYTDKAAIINDDNVQIVSDSPSSIRLSTKQSDTRSSVRQSDIRNSAKQSDIKSSTKQPFTSSTNSSSEFSLNTDAVSNSATSKSSRKSVTSTNNLSQRSIKSVNNENITDNGNTDTLNLTDMGDLSAISGVETTTNDEDDDGSFTSIISSSNKSKINNDITKESETYVESTKKSKSIMSSEVRQSPSIKTSNQQIQTKNIDTKTMKTNNIASIFQEPPKSERKTTKNGTDSTIRLTELLDRLETETQTQN
jgi:hypothetical protein